MKRLYTLISIALLALPTLACTNLLVSKGASKDGSVMVSYAADSHTRYGTLVFMPRATYPKGEMLEIREWGPGRLLGQIPQAEQTYNVIGNMNEHQVLIGESTWADVKNSEIRTLSSTTVHSSTSASNVPRLPVKPLKSSPL